MPRRPAIVTQADVARAIRAVKAAGLTVTAVIVPALREVPINVVLVHVPPTPQVPRIADALVVALEGKGK